MAHITSQTSTQAQSNVVPSSDEICPDLEDSSGGDSSKEGTHNSSSVGAKSGSDSVSSMSPNLFIMADEKPELSGIEAVNSNSSGGGSFEDTSCGVKKKKINKCRKVNKVIRDSRSDSRTTIKGGGGADSAVSCVVAEEQEGCATLNLATSMERVNPELFAFGRSSSPYASSENEWEASDHSDTDADHSDSSDDDNPTSQVDRMIERGARLIMDGENSNLSSETDDTDDSDDNFDSDSDITDVSPLVSNAGSPLGLSPVMSRRNLPSSISNKPPFMRHYSHKGHDGDVEDEEEEDLGSSDFAQWTGDYYSHDNTNLTADSPNMSMVVQALLKFSLETRKNSQDNSHEDLDSVNKNDMSLPPVARTRHHSHHLSPALQANPHHRHLRKSSNHHSRRKNMSFTNEEVRIINRDNSIILEKLLAVNDRQEETTHDNPYYRESSKPATSYINRKRQEDGIQRENLAILRRLQEVKPSRAVTAASRNATTTPPSSHSSSRHHHHHTHHNHHHHSSSSSSNNHHHHHHHHHSKSHTAPHTATTAATARSCSATARHSAFSPPHHHHSPKETAL